jgi:hypothetical protein
MSSGYLPAGHSIWLAGAVNDRTGRVAVSDLTDRVANGAAPSRPQCRERSGYEPSAPIERSRAGGSHFDSAPTLAKRHE